MTITPVSYTHLAVYKRQVFRSMLISLLAGIAGGILFSQLMFLLLLKFVGLPGKLVFRIPFQSVGETILIYLICFFFVLIYDCLLYTSRCV